MLIAPSPARFQAEWIPVGRPESAPTRKSRALRRLVGVAGLAAAVVLAGLLPAAAQAKKEEGFQTAAPSAILIDAESGTVLYEKNADQLMEPSSMAKLMTAEVVFNAVKGGKLRLEDELTVSENAWRRGGAPSRGTTMFAAIHSKIRVSDLLQGAIIQSGNDACITLAEGIAGSEQAFATAMTARARELGLTKSTFTNSTGLPDQGQEATVRELAKLAQHIIRTYPEFYRYYGEREFTWNRIRQTSRNPLLPLNLGADGMEAGGTGSPGLVGSAIQNGLRLIVVVNGAKSTKERTDEARRMLEFGFRGFESRLLFADGDTIGEAKLYGGDSGRVPLVAGPAVRLLVPRGTSDRIIARIVYTGPVRAPVEKGRPIGKLKVWRGENVVLEVPLQAGQDVARGGLAQRAFDAASELVIGLFRAGVERL
jgi:D-alanyl-D-alanine carboxypeptidase (penicillin-binding protein 5/6)